MYLLLLVFILLLFLSLLLLSLLFLLLLFWFFLGDSFFFAWIRGWWLLLFPYSSQCQSVLQKLLKFPKIILIIVFKLVYVFIIIIIIYIIIIITIIIIIIIIVNILLFLREFVVDDYSCFLTHVNLVLFNNDMHITGGLYR